MDWNENNYNQLKILYKPSPSTRVNFTQITNNKVSQYYDRMYKYNPDGQLLHFDNSRTSIIQLTKNLSKNTYLNLGITSFNKKYEHFAFDDKSEYVHNEVFSSRPYSFLTGGSNNSFFNRKTSSTVFKGDVSSQLKNNLVKVGFEYRTNKLNYYSSSYQPSINQISFDPSKDSPFLIDPILPSDSTIFSSKFSFEPYEVSFYLQDKIELKNFIITQE